MSLFKKLGFVCCAIAIVSIIIWLIVKVQDVENEADDLRNQTALLKDLIIDLEKQDRIHAVKNCDTLKFYGFNKSGFYILDPDEHKGFI